jgi:hypothetical protein
MDAQQKFNIERVLKEIDTLSTADKLSELRRYKAEWESLPAFMRLRPLQADFGAQVDAHIERFQHEIVSTPNVFKISNKTGAKSDLLQVFYALHKLNLIVKQEGGHPNQKEFLEEFGKFIGEDWKDPSALISQRKNETEDTKQNEVFEKLKMKWRGT